MQDPTSVVVRLLASVFALILSAGVYAQPEAQPSRSSARFISSILARDGSIKPNNIGSFDPSGYRLAYGPNGEPRFVLAAQSNPAGCNDGWDTTFTTNGADNQVYAIVSDGAGNIYIGGSFTSVQGVPANGIAKWDGTTWTGLGSGIGGSSVRSIAFLGGEIYVGGDFSQAGGLPARNVARWNGSSWSALSTGLGGGTHIVNSVIVFNNEIYASGGFNTADGSPTTGTARWNGTAWVAVGTGAPGGLSATVKNGLIYVGTFGGVYTWDGTAWSTLPGLTGTVNDIAFLGNELWAAGSVTVTGSGGASVARFNGTTWTGLGTFANAVVSAIAVVGPDVYVGGQLPTPTNFFNNIARWNGTSWVGVGTGVTGGSNRVNELAPIVTDLFVGGDFQIAGGRGAKNLAKFVSGTTWLAFDGTGIDSAANAVAVSGSDIYVGGAFTSAGPVTANRIAKWNSVTNTWSSLAGGIFGFNTENSSISAIAVAGSKVYAGGSFSTIGGISANNIAVWNGTGWSALGTGVNAPVTVIIARGEDIYVGGSFQTAGGVTANRVAKWNGTSWSGLNSTLLPTTVSGMAFMGDDLYVGTGTTTVANPAYFSKYDGTSWTALGADLGDRGVSSVAVSGTDVFVAGGFTSINGVTVNRVAKWNGSSWSALGNGLPSSTGQFGGVRLAASGTDLFAIGDFTVAGGGPADRIARWNGTAWSGLGTGLNANATSVTAAGGDVFVGGGFTTAGCNSSPYFARWRQNVWTGSTNSDWHTGTNWGGGSVPPANVGISIGSSDVSITSADVTVSSLVVTGGRTVTVGAGRTLTVTGNLDLGGGNLSGPGTLVVNGDLSLNSGDISGAASININGNLYLNGGKISGTGPVSVTACRAGAIAGGGGTSFIAAPLTRCVNSSAMYRFPVGTGSVYAPVELANISGSGNFTVDARSGAYSDPAIGLPANRLLRWWQLTNGGITQADVSFNYSNSDVMASESRYRAYRISGGSATQVPTTIDTALNRATAAGITGFSAWTLAEGQPAPRTLSGRVTRPGGRGAYWVLVSLTDDQGNTRYTLVNPFGYYRFLDVPTFRQYTVRVISKRYTFAVPERAVEFDEYTTSVDFVSSNH